MATVEVTQHPPIETVAPLPIAGLGMRFVAFILDGLVMFGFLALFFAVGGLQVLLQGDDAPDSAAYTWLGIIGLFFFPFAPAFFALLWAWRSQSLGMMAVGLIITTRDGYRLSVWRAILRTLVWPLSVLPLAAGLVPMFFDHERRALHDYLAGTTVRELR